jgi:hypothetical protein
MHSRVIAATLLAQILAIQLATIPVQAESRTQEPRSQAPLQGTPEEERACNSDTMKYCRSEVPDTFRVLSCLQANRARISKPCRVVLESHGM